jgi:hypothetical protein
MSSRRETIVQACIAAYNASLGGVPTARRDFSWAILEGGLPSTVFYFDPDNPETVKRADRAEGVEHRLCPVILEHAVKGGSTGADAQLIHATAVLGGAQLGGAIDILERAVRFLTVQKTRRGELLEVPVTVVLQRFDLEYTTRVGDATQEF